MLGWSESGPPAPIPESVLGWFDVPQLTSSEDLYLQDEGFLSWLDNNQTLFDDLGLNKLSITNSDRLHFGDEAVVKIPQSVDDRLVSQDQGAFRFRGEGFTQYGDTGMLLPRSAGNDAVAFADGDSSRLKLESGVSLAYQDEGDLVFTPKAEVYTQITVTGSVQQYRVPAWCNFLDIIGLSAGASGETGHGGNGNAGKGGKAGSWDFAMRERGRSNFPSTLIILSVTIGAGGSRPADSDLAGPNAGGATVVTSPETGTILNIPGGSGKAGGQDGESPGGLTVNGVSYTGGAGGTGNGGSATAPGGAGAGGNGGFFTSRTRGGVGSAGRVWIRAYQ